MIVEPLIAESSRRRLTRSFGIRGFEKRAAIERSYIDQLSRGNGSCQRRARFPDKSPHRQETRCQQSRSGCRHLHLSSHIALRDLPHKQPEALFCLVPIVRRTPKLSAVMDPPIGEQLQDHRKATRRTRSLDPVEPRFVELMGLTAGVS